MALVAFIGTEDRFHSTHSALTHFGVTLRAEILSMGARLTELFAVTSGDYNIQLHHELQGSSSVLTFIYMSVSPSSLLTFLMFLEVFGRYEASIRHLEIETLNVRADADM